MAKKIFGPTSRMTGRISFDTIEEAVAFIKRRKNSTKWVSIKRYADRVVVIRDLSR